MSENMKNDEAVKNDETGTDVGDVEIGTDVGDVKETGTEISETAAVEETEASDTESAAPPAKRGISWQRVVAFGVLPALALLLALGAGFLKYLNDSYSDGEVRVDPRPPLSAAEESVQVAKDSTIALLSYTPDKVEQQLGDARNLLTGDFQQSYTDLTNDVVIPGAKEKQISAVASVPAAASVSVSADEAVVLLFVNQTVNVGQDPPSDTASSVRVTLEKVDGRWLISKFDPV